MLPPMSAENPDVLIADDDPVSLLFLRETFAHLGCRPHCVERGLAALQAATTVHFDLLLLDCRMPDCGGAELLARLREKRVAAPAVATSAAVDERMETELRTAGFVDVLAKPATMDDLRRLLRHLVLPAAPAVALDDRAAAQALGGNLPTLRALRALLAEELHALMDDADLAADPQHLRERLHRLRASCGFCGATALATAAAELETALATDPRHVAASLQAFRATCTITVTALRG
jgi:two-component system, OmpR family, response regulator